MATRTEDYPLSPARPSRSRTQALVVAFPTSRALPIPASKEAFGRDHLRALGIVDKQASSKHVAFTRPGGVLHIEDIGSRNGTWIDGVRLPPRSAVELRDGAVLRIGSTLLVVREDFQGPLEPSPDIGDLVGPYGLRGARAAIEGVARARPAPACVLIEGETGSGKELVARAIARALGRDRKYDAVNIAGVAASVFEAQMFGHRSGAFTDAGKGSPGILAAHAGGAVFLDEIGELAPALQAKLLRVLDQREVLAVGAPAPRPAWTWPSSQRRTSRSPTWWSREPSGATSTRGSRSGPSSCQRSAIAQRTSSRSPRRSGHEATVRSILRGWTSKRWSGSSSTRGPRTCVSWRAFWGARRFRILPAPSRRTRWTLCSPRPALPHDRC